MSSVRQLIITLGDQLDLNSAAIRDADPATDCVWMAEASAESTALWTHKSRITLFLSAMRHHRELLRETGFTVHYTELTDAETTLAKLLVRDIKALSPKKLVCIEPGEWRITQMLETVSEETAVPLEIRIDNHFYCTRNDFAQHAEGRKQLRMEFFYRELRRRENVLMDGSEPAGGAWNFDKDNRRSFDKNGPGVPPAPPSFAPDAITREVIALVNKRFPDHPGQLEHFDWAVTREDALTALDDFIAHRLPLFGDYQDAMWTNEPFLYHSLLSPAMNLKLLNPREVVDAAETAWQQDPERYPINAVEGFIRQILGWREYVRGIYWHFMPEYLHRNTLQATHDLPDFYWTGDTDMVCLKDAIGQTLDYGYAHHIQRLMVTGLYALLYGVDPKQVHEWYLAVYVDAVEWVELPNTLGMSQFGDGGVMASKPYVATGKYIQRMSNYCADCRFNPAHATGEDACPFTTLYWDFLQRHQDRLKINQRMTMQLRNLDRKKPEELAAIRNQAKLLRQKE